MKNKLAIIIPAYKSAFLRESLDSLVKQTCQDFNVYIGDDNSPENISEIATIYESKLNVSYHKFSDNIGAKNLVRHWNRCLNLVRGETWVWIFSDDDILDDRCVEVFYETINKDNEIYDVYRFNTRVINDQSVVIAETNESPEHESAEEMALALLCGERGNSMPDHIFRLSAVIKNNGFFYTEFAQAADWASSILFGKSTGIRTMGGPKVNWRIGQFNISGSAPLNRHIMIQGHLRFLEWVYFFLMEASTSTNINELKNAVRINLENVIRNHYKGLDIKSCYDLLCFYKTIGLNFYESLQAVANLYLKYKYR